MITALSIAAACSSNPEPDDFVAPDGQVVTPGEYADPFVMQSRLPGSTFVEIAEVRATDDSTVYFCSAVKGLNIVDATDPTAMQLRERLVSRLGSSRFPKCQHLAVDGQTVYMSSRGDETQPTPFLAMFNASVSPALEVANIADPNATFEGIAAAGGLLYAAMHEAGLGVYRSQGEDLIRLGTATGLTNAWGVALDGSVAFVADGTGGLAAVNIDDPTAPSVISSLPLSGAAQHVELDRDRKLAFVATGQGGMVIVDVADPASLREVAVTDTPGTTLQVALDGDMAYVADWNDVRVFDVSDPAAPRLLTTERVALSTGFPRVLGIGAFGGHAFLGEWTGLYAYRMFPQLSSPDLWIGDREAQLSAGAGEADSVAILLENTGTERLLVWSATTEGAGFSVDRNQVLLDPGERGVVEVVFDASSTDPVSGVLKLHSDDPDESVRKIDLRANRAGISVGDAAPPTGMQLLDGGEWDLADHRGKVVLLAYFATF